jgi:hypothetical protein
MSRLDRHVAMVQNKLALGRFLQALAWSLLVFAAIVWGTILVDKLFQVRPPRVMVLFWAGAGVAMLTALSYAIWKRPSAHAAAAAIDERLALKEKFSTALYVRPLKDPFAAAAVKDAERTADSVTLAKKFPLHFPRIAYGTFTIALAAFLTAQLMKPMDLFGKAEQQKKMVAEQVKREDAKKVVEQALAQVNSVPKGVADNEKVQLAKRDLELMLQAQIKNPEQTKRNAAKALQDVGDALKEQVQKNQKYAEAQADAKMFKNAMPPSDEKGPVADAQRKVAKGEFGQALQELNEAVKKFDKMDQKEQDKAAQQMKNMAQQLQQMANDPKVQEQVQKQLQQAGMNQQQAQQMAQQMQQAANGDKQAQQQLQQAAQQAMQQLQQQAKQGNQQAQQQLQQLQQAMQQAQAQANAQQQAQQMAQAAQQMAQAMQQGAQAAQQNQQQGQQAGQNPQAQQGGQNGQQNMQQAMQQMAQQMQQMQAIQADANQVAAAQQAMAAAAQNAAAGNAPNGNNPAGGQQNNQQGQWNGGQVAGDPKKQGQWNGQAGPAGANQGGQGAGDRTYKAQAPYQVKQEVDSSEDIESGAILANTLVKDRSIKGESKAQLSKVAASALNEATDEIDQERISRQAQKVVKGYFETLQHEAAAAPAATPAK